MAEINVHEALLLVLHHIRSPNSNNAELEIVRMAERVFEDYARGTLDRLLAEKQGHQQEGVDTPAA
jgi:hypothetical protein